MALPRVLLVEDHPLIQQALQSLLSPYYTVVGILDRAEALSQTIDVLQPDVLVLDVSLPGRSGLQVLPEIREAYPQLGIVVATNHTQPIYREEAQKRGADEFVVKDRLQQTLVEAVHSAYAGKRGSLRLKIDTGR